MSTHVVSLKWGFRRPVGEDDNNEKKIKVSKKAQNDFKSILVKWLKHMENDPPCPPPPNIWNFPYVLWFFFIGGSGGIIFHMF